jgi:hypothetical protein
MDDRRCALPTSADPWGNQAALLDVSRAMDTRSRTGRVVGGLATLGTLLTLTVVLTACAGKAAAPPDTPVSAPPTAGPSSDPGAPIGAKPVLPKPGQAVNVHPVSAEGLEARVDGDTILVRATWTSGVEPCTILDSIVVDKGEGTYTVTLREGSSPQEIACIALAEQHVTEFEIPGVAAGTWSIVDSGGLAPAVEVTVG